ncbi:hypothetical protein TWF192_000079 [Orbilia oligospora]|uniref:Uncharacterized protein n=1 Tax=Orbilia oligospora TaxID=2813651 RepID=A0A6G1MNQ2_ORBOL|nr:hypothetical protein TWF679_006858 [Orbilia oligospora]KAF3231367.1 hypothetical protein TWF191_006854 [Orbilia oligospora]KAF3265429.1 hypothetical protein TWF192_000079 [Orbilia oligospora]
MVYEEGAPALLLPPHNKFSTECYIPIIIITTPNNTDVSTRVYQSVVRKHLKSFAKAINVMEDAPWPNVPSIIVKLRLLQGKSGGEASGHCGPSSFVIPQ